MVDRSTRRELVEYFHQRGKLYGRCAGNPTRHNYDQLMAFMVAGRLAGLDRGDPFLFTVYLRQMVEQREGREMSSQA